MTGSSLAPIVIAIVVSIGLAAWLVMVYYAASHPYWKHQRRAHEGPVTGPARQGDRQLDAAARDATPVAAARPSPAPEHAEKPGVPHAA